MAIIRRSVQQRIGGKLRARVDPSDVIQETQLDVVRRLDEYLQNRPMAFRLWLIKLAHQRLSKIERHHLNTAKRAAAREVPLSDRSIDLVRCFFRVNCRHHGLRATANWPAEYARLWPR